MLEVTSICYNISDVIIFKFFTLMIQPFILGDQTKCKRRRNISDKEVMGNI